jgi:hypothetical protein
MKNLVMIRVPKTGTTHLWALMEILEHHHPDEVVLRGGHYPVSEVQPVTGSIWLTMVRNPYQTSLSMFYMLRRMAAKPNFDVDQLARIAEDPEKKNRFVWTPHYQHNLGLARDLSTTPDIWLERSVPNHALAYHFDTMTPSQFDFVGHTDEMTTSEALLQELLPHQPYGHRWNENPDKPIGAKYPEGEYTEAMFRERNAREYDLFDEGMDRYHQLLTQYNL